MSGTIKGRIKHYLRGPLYMIIVMVLATVGLFFYDRRLGFVFTGVTVLYSLYVIIFHRINRSKLDNELIEFATSYGTVQRRILKEFPIPYALLDAGSRVVWMNDCFRELIGLEADFHKSLGAVFPSITREMIAKSESGHFDMNLELGDRIYDAQIEKLVFEEEFSNRGNLLDAGVDSLVALTLFDITENKELKHNIVAQKLVTALVYIDNYEETMESVEDVKRSLLVAIIDRRISRYFRASDAIIRKTDKDKYFIIFQQRYLEKMEENKFSILEDVRTIKAGNENEITLSIGIGLGAENYVQSAEFSRAAIDLALGRGGAQVVIKDGDEVSYYGAHGKEIERTTRVKARVKAQALREVIESRDDVIVMGHQISDPDALGAAIGVYCAARELGKKCRIVLNTITSTLQPLVDGFSVDNGYPSDMFITSQQAMEYLTRRSVVMVVDTNRPSYTECPQLLQRTDCIVVFDHHRQGSERIESPVLSYIEPYASSACEMIAETLQYFSDRMQLSHMEADAIFAGIMIDTNNFMTKTGVRTFEAAAYLKRSGADTTRVRRLLRENMASYKARAEVVRNAEVFKGAFAISVCDAIDVESPTIVGAQAANELLNIVGIKASFVLTAYNKKVYVSSRSIDEINVQVIMERLGGGGHLNVAGAQVQGESLNEVKKHICDILAAMIKEGEIVL